MKNKKWLHISIICLAGLGILSGCRGRHNKEELTQIKSYIEKIKKILKEETKIEYYISSVQLAEKIKNPEEKKHDIYILDIDMPDLTGLELAAIINRQHPVRYVYKVKMEEQLREALVYAIEQSKEIQKRSITLKHYRDCHRVKISEIMYVQRVGRQLEIHRSGKESIIETSSLEDLFGKLNDRRFVFIERGCFINIDYVYKVTKRYVYLTDGTELIISRRLIAEIKEKITELWNENL